MSYTDDQKETIREYLIQEIEDHLPASGLYHYDGVTPGEIAPEIADMAIDILGYYFCDEYVNVIRNCIGNNATQPKDLMVDFLEIRKLMDQADYN